jgi:hypothetical protein
VHAVPEEGSQGPENVRPTRRYAAHKDNQKGGLMPKDRRKSDQGSGNKISISYATVGVIGSILAIVFALWTVANKVATKEDVESIKATITPTLTAHESRIRDLELQFARYFGASQTSAHPTPASDVFDDRPIKANFVLAAQYGGPYPQTQAPAASAAAPRIPPNLGIQRITVVPFEMIKQFNMEPTIGGAYAVLGEDGRYYNLDQVLSILIRMHFQERKR